MLNILVCLYLLNSMHRRVVSTHSRSSSLPIFLTLVLTFRTVTMCTSFSECSAFSVRKSTWVTAFVCHFPNEKFSRFLSGVFQFYLRLVRRKNWFLNCNSVKVRFVFNSLWIKFTGCVCAVFFFFCCYKETNSICCNRK